jgi:hypothetical protein
MAQQPLVGQGLLTIAASRSHSDTPHSAGLLCTSDQPDAETSTWQHTTNTVHDKHPCPGGIRTHNPSKRGTADPRVRPRGQLPRDRQLKRIRKRNSALTLENSVHNLESIWNIICYLLSVPPLWTHYFFRTSGYGFLYAILQICNVE